MTAPPPAPELRAADRLLGLVQPGEREWWVALSGGSDSIFLLLAARLAASRAGARLAVAHLNHGWRGDESDRDEARARQLALEWGLELVVAGYPPAPGAHPNRLDWARRCRRALLERLAGPHGLVLLGHQRDDQAETVLAGLLEGRAPWGVHPLRERRGRWIRPLLTLSAAEIRARLAELCLAWREDRSNRDTTRQRAWIRHELLAPLRRQAPGEVDALLDRVAAALAQAGAEREQFLLELLDKLDLRPVPGGASLERAGFHPYHGSLSADLLRLLGRRLGLWGRDPSSATLAGWAGLVARGQAGQRVPLGRRAWLDLGRTQAWLLRRLPVPRAGVLRPEGRLRLGEVELGWGTPPADAQLGPTCGGTHVVVRTWLPGDRGTDGASLAGRMGRLGFPPARKELQPVVIMADRVVWAPGLEPHQAPGGGEETNQPRMWVRPCN